MAIKVKAKETGFYGTKLRYEGDEFEVAHEHELGRWMEVLGATPEAEPASDGGEEHERPARVLRTRGGRQV